ncbi:MAG: hypothetical protein KOO66_07535 [Bacteroidales bacterium]|nr:hypothetical protein [Bacteroidales bacterium]
MQALKKFIIREIVFASILGVIAYILFQTILEEYYLPIFWILFGLITVFTAVFHFSVLQVSEKEPSKFSSRFMMVSGIKMIIYLIIIVFYAFSFPEKAKIFLISFFILYSLYTVFEVILIINYFKKRN